MTQIAVLGAGLSGLAAAERLLTERPGVDVTVYEAAPRLGGKTASWQDADGETVEIGLHVCFPHYDNLLGLMERAGCGDRILWRDHVLTYIREDGDVSALRFADLPAPLHAVAATRLLEDHEVIARPDAGQDERRAA
jgi:zeta-carotene desaturase